MSRMSDLYEKETGELSHYLDVHGSPAESKYVEWLERRAEVSKELEEALMEAMELEDAGLCFGEAEKTWGKCQEALSKAKEGT